MEVSAARIAASSRSGAAPAMIAAAPETMGAAIEVPVRRPCPPIPTGRVDVMPTPGATRESCGPRLERGQIARDWSTAPTLRTPGIRAGQPTAEELLPAAATTTAFLERA